MDKKQSSVTRGRGRGHSRFGGQKPFSGRQDADTDSVLTVKNGRPSVKGFANAGAVFGAKDNKDVLHPQMIKMARKSGSLNLCNRSLDEVPAKVFRLHEQTAEEARANTLSMDAGSEDRWWESVDLSKLFLSSNTISVLPAEVALLGGLTVLDLSDNQLTTLPAELGELKLLQRLSLSHNRLTELPSEALALPDLRLLKLDHNSLAQLPDLEALTVLDQLDVSHNQLTQLSASLCHLSRVTKLNVSYNKLTALGSELGDLSNLAELDANHNTISRVAPQLTGLTKLTRVYLHNNRVAEWPEGAMPALKELHMATNCVKVLKPSVLEGLRGLVILDLRDNQLDTLPNEITLLQAIERLDLANNTLSSIPPHLGLLPHLRSLPLDGNPLRLLRRDIIARGTPALLKHLREKLDPKASYPGFGEGAVAAALGDHCDGPPEPACADQYQMKQARKAAYNKKAADIPEDFLKAAVDAAVPALDVSGNLLTQLPEGIAALAPHTRELTASCNRLTSLPACLGAFLHLQFLDVHANRLETLPDCLGELKQLRELNATHNRLSAIPASLASAPALETLMLSDNRLSAVDPSLLASMPRLATLHLNNNDIGVLPPKLGELTQLRSLLLEGNPFRVPRAAILAKGTEEVLEYLRGRIVPE